MLRGIEIALVDFAQQGPWVAETPSMTTDLDSVSLAWIDDIAATRSKPTPLEIALWLDSFVTQGNPIDVRLFLVGPLEKILRVWPPRARA